MFDEAAGGQDERIAGKAARRLGEIGPAPHLHFATHGKLASWVTLCPGNNISVRKRKHGRTGDAGTYIKPMLVQAAGASAPRCCP